MSGPEDCEEEIKGGGPHAGECHFCDASVGTDCYCYGCKVLVCEDCVVGYSVADAGIGPHAPEDHLVEAEE